jgi:endonuclease I
MPKTKKKTSVNKKTLNKAKKILNKKHKGLYNIISIIVLIVSLTFGGFYIINQSPKYSSSQNNDGFYYYSLVDEGDYYFTANNLIGNALKDQLNTIINQNFIPVSYGDARYSLEKTDQLVNDTSLVYKIYDGFTSPSTWDAESWHREHVWPNSRLGIDRVTQSSKNQGSDLHNLRAITPSVNSSKSDRFFSDSSGENKTTSDGGYYPGDDHKGDVARILFYMAVMYDFLILTDDNLEDESNHYTLDGAKMGKLSLLLIWHKEDPVDDFERRRNQVIFEEQGNRNPFIDKPEYVHLIFENKTINELLKEDSTLSYQMYVLIDKKRGLFYV